MIDLINPPHLFGIILITPKYLNSMFDIFWHGYNRENKRIGYISTRTEESLCFSCQKDSRYAQEDKIKLLKRKSNIDKLIKDAREELING